MLCQDRDWLYRATPEDIELYLRMIPHDHRLLKALEAIDFEALIPEVSAGYCVTHGQPAIPPLIAFKLELLKHLYNLSDRGVMLRTETDVAFRYFLQVPVRFWPPDHTLLVRFRGRLGEDGYRRVFQKIISQARAAGLVKDQLRLKDATHVLANISIPSTIALAAQVRDGLIDALAAVDPQVAQGYRIAADQVRQQTQQMDDALRLNQRIELLQDIIQSAQQVGPEVKLTKRQRQKLDEALQLAGRLVTAHQQPNRPGKIRSTADPEAGRGKHGVFYDGYVLDVAMDADSELITAIDVLPAGGNEAESAVRLIQQEHDHQGNQVEAISIDGAGHNGAMIRAFEGETIDDPAAAPEPTAPEPTAPGPTAGGMNVTVYVPPKRDRSDVAIPGSEFILSDDGQSVRCPEGKMSSYHNRQQDGSTMYRFAKATCEGCPLVSLCSPKLGKSPFGRSVSKSRYAAEYARIKERSTGEAFAEVRRRHGAIERKLSELVNQHGGRRARYWGRSKVAIQQYGIAMAVNLKRMIKLMAVESLRPEAIEIAT